MWNTFRRKYRSCRNWPLLTACSGSLLVAAITRTSTGVSLLLPSRRTLRSSNTRNSFACVGAGISPISSSSSVPESASSKHPMRRSAAPVNARSEEHTSELQSPCNLVCRLLLEKKTTAARHGRPPSTHTPTHRPSPPPPLRHAAADPELLCRFPCSVRARLVPNSTGGHPPVQAL